MLNSCKMFAAAITLACLSVTAHADGPPPMTGQWEHKADKNSTLLTIAEDNRIHLVIRTKDTSFTLHGNYHLTNDGLLYGVVTSVESEDEEADELIDQPFSFRYRIDEGALIIGNYNGLGKNVDGKQEFGIKGRYRQVLPTPTRSVPAPGVPSQNISSVSSKRQSQTR